MELKDKIIIGLLSIVLIVCCIGVFGSKSGKLGSYDETYTNFTNLKATGALVSEGTMSVSGVTTLSGTTNYLNNPINQGSFDSISTSSATYSLISTDLCGPIGIKFTVLGASATVTLPATSTMLASGCLNTVGNSYYVGYSSIGTSSVIAAPSGVTLGVASTTTVLANKSAIFNIIRDSATTYTVQMLNFNN